MDIHLQCLMEINKIQILQITEIIATVIIQNIFMHHSKIQLTHPRQVKEKRISLRLNSS